MDRPQSPTPEEMMPRPAAIFLLAPIVAVGIVFGLYVYLFWHGYVGRVASGETVAMHFEGCTPAQEVVLARAEEMGLGSPVLVGGEGSRFTLAAMLPEEPEARSAIPETLATRGLLELHGGGEVLITNADLVSSSVRLDITMSPTTLLVLTLDGAKVVAKHMNAYPDDRMDYILDGDKIHDQSNRKPFSEAELEIPPSAENDRARMALAAHWGIVMGRPLPCDVSLRGVEAVENDP
jgi:hypothetical protein